MNLLYPHRVTQLADRWPGVPPEELDQAIQLCLEVYADREGIYLDLDGERAWGILEPNITARLQITADHSTNLYALRAARDRLRSGTNDELARLDAQRASLVQRFEEDLLLIEQAIADEVDAMEKDES